MHANRDRWRAVKDSERRGGRGEEQKDSLEVFEVLLQERALLPGAGMGAAPGMSSPCEGALRSHCGGKWKELCLAPTPLSAHVIAFLACSLPSSAEFPLIHLHHAAEGHLKPRMACATPWMKKNGLLAIYNMKSIVPELGSRDALGSTL